MSETCENACPALTRLEQQVDVIRQQNGDDHKEFRQQIHKIERDEARQEAKLDNITSALSAPERKSGGAGQTGQRC